MRHQRMAEPSVDHQIGAMDRAGPGAGKEGDAAVRAQIAKTGLLESLSTPEAFGQFLQAETNKLQALVKSGVRIELN